MKSRIIYIAVFLAAFILTTAVIIYMNNQYKNIFKFDFTSSPVDSEKIEKPQTAMGSMNAANINELRDYIKNEFRKDLLDSIRSYRNEVKHDTIKIVKDAGLSDSLIRVQSKMNELKSNLANKEQEVKNFKNIVQVKNDSAYVKWKKEMVKIYESMDSKAAARIIQNLSETMARDILFSMKKKKAAEIITRLNPETATRLTRMQ